MINISYFYFISFVAVVFARRQKIKKKNNKTKWREEEKKKLIENAVSNHFISSLFFCIYFFVRVFGHWNVQFNPTHVCCRSNVDFLICFCSFVHSFGLFVVNFYFILFVAWRSLHLDISSMPSERIFFYFVFVEMSMCRNVHSVYRRCTYTYMHTTDRHDTEKEEEEEENVRKMNRKMLKKRMCVGRVRAAIVCR